MLSNAIWNVQNVLHSNNSFALPGTLMLSASSLLVYKHMTDEREGFDSLKTFLVLILIQMVPLLVLEMKILACPDPVELLARFGPKVLLMHAAFLALRVVGFFFMDTNECCWNVARVACACIALHKGFGFRFSPASILAHLDVWLLVLTALLAASSTKLLDWLINDAPFDLGSLSSLNTASDYIEILAFVPAVWMVLKSNQNQHVTAQTVATDPRKRVLYFFAFLVSFYFTEDILGAFQLYQDIPLAAAGHTLHFLLLIDFAGFLLAHIYNPEKLKGELLRWLPGSDSYEV